MRLVLVLTMVLAQLGAGTLLLASLLPTREIRSSFFSFHSAFGAIALGLALILSKFSLSRSWWDLRYLELTVTGALAAGGCFRFGRFGAGRLFLAGAGALGLACGVLPLARLALTSRGGASSAAGLFQAGALAGALLLGATHVGMVLGHWYLLMRQLSFVYLERFARLLLAAVGIRIAVVIGTFVLLGRLDPDLAARWLPSLWSVDGHLFFFLIRIVWGLALPLVLGIYVWRLVRLRSNQAATGMLYVIEVSVLFGELFAAYLMI